MTANLNPDAEAIAEAALRDAIAQALAKRYGTAIAVTDAMIDAVIAGVDLGEDLAEAQAAGRPVYVDLGPWPDAETAGSIGAQAAEVHRDAGLLIDALDEGDLADAYRLAGLVEAAAAAIRAALGAVEGATGTLAEAVAADLRAFPHDDPCPHCGHRHWTEADPQQCGYCGTRICPVCGADFAEDYAGAVDLGRTSDNLGAHLAQVHPDVKV